VPIRIFGAYDAWPIGQKWPRLFQAVTVVVGEPIYFSESDLQPATKDLYQRLSQRVMDAIAALRME
jgi:1-acyl-sn-glycerol-3-phosphate acyltransferase